MRFIKLKVEVPRTAGQPLIEYRIINIGHIREIRKVSDFYFITIGDRELLIKAEDIQPLFTEIGMSL